MLPPFHFWFTGSALFTIGSFVLFAVLGFAGIAQMSATYRRLMIGGYIVAFVLGFLGWRQAAKQEQDSSVQQSQYSALQTTLETLQSTLKRIADFANVNPVSYTHLTLPTILRV